MDPRIEGTRRRLSEVKEIIGVFSGKGGVGKSLISTCLAVSLAELGKRVGLLDLDFHGASDHIILGVDLERIPEEEKGIVPPEERGVKFMTIAYYSKDSPLPIRGNEVSDAILEILSITRWGPLDFLVIDLPPGLGDPFLDTIKLIQGAKYLGIGIPSKLSFEVLRRSIKVLLEAKREVIGILENMSRGERALRPLAEEFGLRYLGEIPYYEDLEEKIGKDELFSSEFFRKIEEISERIF